MSFDEIWFFAEKARNREIERRIAELGILYTKDPNELRRKLSAMRSTDARRHSGGVPLATLQRFFKMRTVYRDPT